MNIICPKCKHDQQFNVEVEDYKGYVCPSCYSYYKTEFNEGNKVTEFTFVKKLTKPSNRILTKLNEQIIINDNVYYIITIIERWTDDTVNYEYVGLSENNEDIYFSHGNDYFCRLKKINSSNIKLTNKSESIRISNQRYFLEFIEQCKVENAIGFVFEDLSNISENLTYILSYDDSKFISEEIIDGEKEYYWGTYLSNIDFEKYFPKLKNFKNIESVAQSLFFKIFGFVTVVLIIIFLSFNYNNIRTQHINKYENFTSLRTSNQFIGESFTLNGNRKKLIFNGISESNKVDINFLIKLVNEETNEVQESRILTHYNNDFNFASGITIDFCRVNAGTYHLVFETYSNHDEPIEYKIDYRLQHGGDAYFPLIIALIILIFIGVKFFYLLFKNDNIKFYERKFGIDYKLILKQQKLGYYLLALILIFLSYMMYVNYVKECTTSTSMNTLEDHTYTGSRTHYYRSYNSYGSGHK